MISKENVDPERQDNSKDKTNWNAWYIGLISFLLVQIIIYYLITNLY
jgi:hypothetical protein